VHTATANRVAIALIVVCQSTQALAFGGIALFLPLIRDDVDLTFSQAGTLAGAATLVYALMQVPAGYLADRFGARRLFVIGLVGTNLLSLAFALLHSYPLLLLNQAASGFFRSLMFAPGMLLIAAHFPPGRRASALGLYVAGGFSSNILLSSLGPAVVGDVGWRLLFVGFSVLGLLAVAAYAALPAPPPRTAGSPVRLRELWPLLREPVLRLAGVVQFVRLAVVTGLGFWLPTYLVVDKGFSLQAAGLVVALGAALTAPANILGGYVSDRLGRPLLVIGVSLGMLGVTLALLVTARAAAAVVVLVGVNAVFLQVYFGPLFQVPIQVLGERTAGLTSGVSNFCANVGGFVAASSLGAVKDVSGSFAPGLLALAVLCGVGLAATSALRSRTAPAASPSPG
jgi:predicted MFS family arabinose efflux permease